MEGEAGQTGKGFALVFADIRLVNARLKAYMTSLAYRNVRSDKGNAAILGAMIQRYVHSHDCVYAYQPHSIHPKIHSIKKAS